MLASSRKAAGHRNAWGNIHFSRSLSFAARLPGGRDRPPYNARQTAGGIKTPLCGKGHFTGICSRFWHLFPADRRAGVHARRETFRQSRRFRADENHRPLRSTTRREGPLRRGRCSHRPAKLPATAMLGVHIQFFPPPSVSRQIARRAKSPAALQYKANGRRNRKLRLCCRRFFSRRPFTVDRRAGVHARRETFRQSRRFRADEDHCRPQAAFRRLPGAQRRCKSRRSAPTQHDPAGRTLRRGRCLHRPMKFPVTAMLWGRIPFFPPPSVCRQVARRARSPALQCKANGRWDKNTALRQGAFYWHLFPVLAPFPGRS